MKISQGKGESASKKNIMGDDGKIGQCTGGDALCMWNPEFDP